MDDRIEKYKALIMDAYRRAPWGKPVVERARAVADIEDGMTFRAAADKYGIGTAHLQRYCKMCDVRSKRTRLTKEQLAEVVEDIRTGLERAVIAERWNLSSERVYRIGYDAGIKNGGK